MHAASPVSSWNLSMRCFPLLFNVALWHSWHLLIYNVLRPRLSTISEIMISHLYLDAYKDWLYTAEEYRDAEDDVSRLIDSKSLFFMRWGYKCNRWHMIVGIRHQGMFLRIASAHAITSSVLVGVFVLLTNFKVKVWHFHKIDSFTSYLQTIPFLKNLQATNLPNLPPF